MPTRPPAELIRITNMWLEQPLEVRRSAAHRIVERGKSRDKVAKFLLKPVKDLNAVDISIHLPLLKPYDEMSLVLLRGKSITDVEEEPSIISVMMDRGSVLLRNVEVGTYRLLVPMDPGIIMLDDTAAFFNA